MRIKGAGVVLAAAVFLFAASSAGAAALPFTSTQLLGGALYFDKNLSVNRNQACQSCHVPVMGFDDPDSNLPVSQGSVLTLFGSRNAPSSAYAAFSPGFGWYFPDGPDGEGLYMGGQFWDGRVTNQAEQAMGPPNNPVEMGLPDHATVVKRLAERPLYVLTFKILYGIDIRRPASVEAAYTKMGKAIGEFERTSLFNSFTSKYDFYLMGRARLTRQELRGLELYGGKANCVACHPHELTYDGQGKPIPPMFTDFSYDNLGIPINPEIAQVNGKPMPIDYGLGRNPVVLADANSLGLPMIDPDGNGPVATDEMGKFKVMSLRNIAVTAPYGHNGYFKTLKEIVHFYNTPSKDFTPEVAANVNMDELHDGFDSNLEGFLTDAEENDLVAFLKTLTDGYRLVSPYGRVDVPEMPGPGPVREE